MQYLMLLTLGAVLCVLGIGNLRGDMSSVHTYLRFMVRPENLAGYSRRMGTGTLICGLSVLGVAVSQMIHETELAWWLLLAGVMSGFGLMLFAQVAGSGLMQQLRISGKTGKAADKDGKSSGS
ncbi:MAG: hypothetical protein HDQ87_09745 [Clostridia bacterium]|nr:hypothetical protein [Clostridia bacterium]